MYISIFGDGAISDSDARETYSLPHPEGASVSTEASLLQSARNMSKIVTLHNCILTFCTQNTPHHFPSMHGNAACMVEQNS